MVIRVGKCCTFGMKRTSSKSAQYLTEPFIDKEPVPCVKNRESFRYFGQTFDFNRSTQMHKTEFFNMVISIPNAIDSLLLYPKNKLLLCNRYLFSKISWHFTVCDLSKTWICQNLDNAVSLHICKCLDQPISSTLSNNLLLREKFGLGIILPSTKFTQCQTVDRNALSHPLMKLYGIFRKIQAIPRIFNILYTKIQRKF